MFINFDCVNYYINLTGRALKACEVLNRTLKDDDDEPDEIHFHSYHWILP